MTYSGMGREIPHLPRSQLSLLESHRVVQRDFWRAKKKKRCFIPPPTRVLWLRGSNWNWASMLLFSVQIRMQVPIISMWSSLEQVTESGGGLTDWDGRKWRSRERATQHREREKERQTDWMNDWLMRTERQRRKWRRGRGGRGESTERGRREREKDGLHKAERFRIGKLDNAIQRSLRKRLFHQHESRMNARNTYHAALDSTERARTN